MSIRSRRLAVAAVIAASAIAVPAAALASVSGTSSGKPTPSAAATKPAATSGSAAATKPAAASGSAAATKPAAASGSAASKPAAASGSAAASKSAARRSGALRSVTMPAMVAALAAQLGVSHSAAQHAFDQLDALNGTGGIDPASLGFAAIAHDLGVTPAQLAAALRAAKQAAMQSVAGR
jgi:hypothetical protein